MIIMAGVDRDGAGASPESSRQREAGFGTHPPSSTNWRQTTLTQEPMGTSSIQMTTQWIKHQEDRYLLGG